MKLTKMVNIVWWTKCALLNFVHTITCQDPNGNNTSGDNQPDILSHELIEENHENCSYPSTLPLMPNKNEKLKCRKVRSILQYHAPNQNKRPEEYALHLLFVYYPFRNEEELRQETYMEKLVNPEVMRVMIMITR